MDLNLSAVRCKAFNLMIEPVGWLVCFSLLVYVFRVRFLVFDCVTASFDLSLFRIGLSLEAVNGSRKDCIRLSFCNPLRPVKQGAYYPVPND